MKTRRLTYFELWTELLDLDYRAPHHTPAEAARYQALKSEAERRHDRDLC